VVGDGKGRVGYWSGKAKEVPAHQEGIEDRQENMIASSMSGTTIPHAVLVTTARGKSCSSPSDGPASIAGGPVRAILESAGIQKS